MKEHKHVNDSNETRIALLEQAIGHTNETLIRFEKRFDKIDERFNRIDAQFDAMDRKFETRFDSINSRFDSIDKKLWAHLLWTVSGFAGLLFVMAKGFGWL